MTAARALYAHMHTCDLRGGQTIAFARGILHTYIRLIEHLEQHRREMISECAAIVRPRIIIFMSILAMLPMHMCRSRSAQYVFGMALCIIIASHLKTDMHSTAHGTHEVSNQTATLPFRRDLQW